VELLGPQWHAPFFSSLVVMLLLGAGVPGHGRFEVLRFGVERGRLHLVSPR
jgi:hypothetical protein